MLIQHSMVALVTFGIFLFNIYGKCFAQDTIWINNVAGEALIDYITPQQAKEKARWNAYTEALRRCGVQITASQFLMQSESYKSVDDMRRQNNAFVSVVKTTAQGIVTATRNEQWKNEQIEQNGNPPLTKLILTLDARVTKPQGERDQDFQVTMKLKHHYIVDDEVAISITATKDCYLNVFNIVEDSVILLYPNEYVPDVFLSQKGVFTIPQEGLGSRAELPPGWTASEEMVMVIATKTKREFLAGTQIKKTGYAKTRQSALLDLMNWIATIKLEDIADVIERFEIVKK